MYPFSESNVPAVVNEWERVTVEILEFHGFDCSPIVLANHFGRV